MPVDGSPQADAALQKAIYIARVNQASLTILNVIDLNRKLAAFEQVSLSGYVPQELLSKAQERLSVLTAAISPDIAYELETEIGVPAEIIVERAKSLPAGLIVMGSRGLGAFKRFLMGSVSHYVLQYASCPVLIVR